jgi:hypothetical protein
VGGDISINGETILVSDFVNLKIKSAQYFRCAHKNRMCVHIFIEVSAHTYMNIYVQERSQKSNLRGAKQILKHYFFVQTV